MFLVIYIRKKRTLNHAVFMYLYPMALYVSNLYDTFLGECVLW